MRTLIPQQVQRELSPASAANSPQVRLVSSLRRVELLYSEHSARQRRMAVSPSWVLRQLSRNSVQRQGAEYPRQRLVELRRLREVEVVRAENLQLSNRLYLVR